MPKAFLEHGIFEVLIRGKLEADGDGSWIAMRQTDLEVGDGEVDEGGEEEGGVGGLDVLIDVGGCLFENEGPEVGDGGGEFVTAGVEGFCEGSFLPDCEGREELVLVLVL